jgi:uncharacterized protein YecE (DUF72 family)
MTQRVPQKRRGAIRIGTSGWTYDGWRGPFYPQRLPKKDWLRHYASCFSTTEINGSFYRTPSLDAVGVWRDSTPDDFKFAWKASKFITHWKRLGESSINSIALMETRLEALSGKDCAVLFQLPPNFVRNDDRLSVFLGLLPQRRRYAFEFRHTSWYCDSVFNTLKAHNIALCISDHGDAPSPWEVTADHVYIRGHGPSGRYHGSYRKPALEKWAHAILRWASAGHDVLVYFDNDQKAAAPADALRLASLLGGDSAKRSRRGGIAPPASRWAAILP